MAAINPTIKTPKTQINKPILAGVSVLKNGIGL